MTTPTVPPTSEPVEVPERTVPPETRPEPALPDDCQPIDSPYYPGLTRWTATPCDPATGQIIPATVDDCQAIDSPFYPGLTRFTVTPCDPATGELLPSTFATATDSVAPASVVVAPQSLPETGANEVIQSGLAAALLAIGVVLVRLTRRNHAAG